MKSLNGLAREVAKAKKRMQGKILRRNEKRDFEVIVKKPGYEGLRRREDVL